MDAPIFEGFQLMVVTFGSFFLWSIQDESADVVRLLHVFPFTEASLF